MRRRQVCEVWVLTWSVVEGDGIPCWLKGTSSSWWVDNLGEVFSSDSGKIIVGVGVGVQEGSKSTLGKNKRSAWRCQ